MNRGYDIKVQIVKVIHMLLEVKCTKCLQKHFNSGTCCPNKTTRCTMMCFQLHNTSKCSLVLTLHQLNIV